jgi:dipeptidyl aminopeptidase/acylaminoacyl peptidase
METVEYAPGRLADVFGDSSRPVILLWHGMQADARATVRPLAVKLAVQGAAVVVPDWNSHSDDGGRAELLRSLDFARDFANGNDIVLIGWSLGGAAAAGLTFDAARFDVTLSHTICLAGAFTYTEPISGQPPADGLPAYRLDSPFTLLHGLADEAVPVKTSRRFATDLEEAGWSVELVELAADHGSIVGAEYDPAGDRYEPATGGQALAVAGEVAAQIAATLRYE